MIIIPAAVLLFMTTLIAGGPRQFIRLLDYELRAVAAAFTAWVSLWF